jgi:hypothetical protein
MNAEQLISLQEVFQAAIDQEFSHEYLMNDLYQADIF